MTAQPAAGPLDTLEALRAEHYPDVPAGLLAEVFRIEVEAQFETERGPVQARVRDLIASDEDPT
jgi:hypothetical protein